MADPAKPLPLPADLLSSVPQALADASGALRAVNEAWAAAVGRTATELVGSRPEGLPDLLGDAPRSGELIVGERDGVPVVLQVHAQRLGEEWALLGWDVTCLVAQREQLRAGEARWQALAERASDLGVLGDAEGNLLWISPSAQQLFGHDDGAVLGTSGLDFVHPDDVSAVEEAFATVLATPGAEQVVRMRVRHADGGWRWIEEQVRNMLDVPGVEAVVANLRDVTAQQASEEQLRTLALYDPATGLPNRTLLLDRLERAGQIRPGETSGVLVVQLLGLQELAGHEGHAVGDAAVAQVARRLTNLLEDADTLARVDSGVLVLLRPGVVEVHDLAALAQEAVGAVAEPVRTADGEARLRCVVGLSERPSEQAGLALGDAMLAMNRARRRGEGQVVRYDATLRIDAGHRRDLAAQLRRDLAAGRVCPWYQPMVDLDTGRATGWEALLRWDRGGGRVSEPEDFFSVADDEGLMPRLGSLALELACRDAASWGPEVGDLAVNVLPAQLLAPGFPEEVERVLAETGLAPQRLVLELTEESVLRDTALARTVLQRLRGHGVRLALDDFGTGWSSMLQLTALPVDCVKIDRVFVEGMLADRGKRLVVASTLDLAARLGAHAIAEGVTAPEQAKALLAMGCGLGQGYLWSPAVPPADVPDLVQRLGPLATLPPSDEPQLDREAVALARRMRQQALSLHTIAAALNKEKLAPLRGRRWSSVRVAELLDAADEAGL